LIRYTILGGVEVASDGRACTPSAPKVRQVLALLLLQANRLVQADAIIEELWADSPPKSALITAQTYIYQLRRLMKREGLNPAGGQLLISRPTGYQLQVEPRQLDIRVFQELLGLGRQLMEENRPRAAAQRFRAALDLWTGPPLTNIPLGPLLSTHAIQLEEQHLRALELRIQAEVMLSRERELIGELRFLVTAYPLNEWFHGQLIRALHRAGRRSEALEAYHQVRRVLSAELGVDPSPELQRLHHEALTAGVPARTPALLSRAAVP
jgi:SARP family transcriptional regulator, regulator of embCAB operon